MKIGFEYALPDSVIALVDAVLLPPEEENGIHFWWVDQLTVKDRSGNVIEIDDQTDLDICTFASNLAAAADEDGY